MQLVEATKIGPPSPPPVPPDMYIAVRPHWAGDSPGWIWVSTTEEVGSKPHRTDEYARDRAEKEAARHPGAFVVFVPGGAR